MMTVTLMNMIACFSQFKYGTVVHVKKYRCSVYKKESLKQHLAFTCFWLSACAENYEQWLPLSGH